MKKRILFLFFVVLNGMCLHAQSEELVEPSVISIADVRDYSVVNSGKDSLSLKLNYYVEYLNDQKNFAVIRQGKDYYSYLYAFYNTKTEALITPFVFKNVTTYDKDMDRYIVVIKKNFGVVNSSGKFIIPCIYSNLNRMKVGNSLFYIAQLFDKWGVLDINNSVIVPFEYDRINLENETYLMLKKGNQMQVTDFISKKVYLSGYEEISFMYRNYNEEQLLVVKKNGLYNIVDMNGVPKLKDWHESIDRESSYYVISDNGYYGINNKDGSAILPQQYDRISVSDRSNRTRFTVKKNGLTGITNETGKFIIPLEYQMLDHVYDDSVLIAKKKGKYGLISSSNKIILPFEYEEISSNDGVCRVTKGGKTGLTDTKGKVLIPVKYEVLLRMNFSSGISPVKSKNVFLASLDGNEGVVSSSGEILIPFEYHFLKEETYGGRVSLSYPLVCSKKGKYGAIDLDNKVVTPFEYDALSQSNPFTFVASKNGKFGLKKAYSEDIILPYEYDFIISNSDSGNLMVYKNGQFEEYELVGEKLYKK